MIRMKIDLTDRRVVCLKGDRTVNETFAAAGTMIFIRSLLISLTQNFMKWNGIFQLAFSMANAKLLLQIRQVYYLTQRESRTFRFGQPESEMIKIEHSNDRRTDGWFTTFVCECDRRERSRAVLDKSLGSIPDGLTNHKSSCDSMFARRIDVASFRCQCRNIAMICHRRTHEKGPPFAFVRGFDRSFFTCYTQGSPFVASCDSLHWQLARTCQNVGISFYRSTRHEYAGKLPFLMFSNLVQAARRRARLQEW
jgi:hypothetical protein